MFTGLIADLGVLAAVELDGDGATLRVRTPLAGALSEGDSIAVNGVCLTATRVGAGEGPAVGVERERTGGEAEAEGGSAGEFEAQAIRETLARSTLGALAPGDPVNLELPLRADGRLGGHFVQGHVDGVGTVAEVRAEGLSRVLGIETDADLLRLVVEKGSITLDGVSLTVSALRADGFEVSLIPETLERTTLGRAVAGWRVNLEADVLAKHVERLLDARAARG